MRLNIPNETLFPKINTLRFRFSIVYVAVIGLVLVLFQGALYYNYVHSMSKEFDARLKMKVEQMGGAVNTFRSLLGKQRQSLTLAAYMALNLSIEYPRYIFMPESWEKFWLADAKKLGLDDDYLVILDSQGNVIAQSSNISGDLLAYFRKIGRLNRNEEMFYKANIDKDILRIFMAPYYYSYRQSYAIAVGTSYAPFERALWHHFLFFLAFTSAFLVIASLIVRIFVIRILSPVMEISKAARDISQENLNARIILTHADEEIEHLTGSLNEMIARLEKSFAHIKEFSIEMAHEVKTPLAIISGESQLALEKDHTSAEYQKIFRTVLKETKRTQRFISDLLLLTKLDYRLIKLRFKPVELNGFLQEISEEMRAIFFFQGVNIQQDIPVEPVVIQGDKVHLRRVFFNLIDNALKFTPQGGRISISAKTDGQNAVVCVSDTGCGFAPQEAAKIFNKFYQVVGDDDGPVPGCGLGLSIVYSIIRLHGGSITAHSVLGEGATFRMEFPFINSRSA